MKRKQRERHELKMYLKTLRYGARYDVVTTPAVRELIINKKKRRGQQLRLFAKKWVRKRGNGNE